MNLRTGAITVVVAMVASVTLMASLPTMKERARTHAGDAPTGPHSSDAGATPVLVELFTSEGCSSCPPADALLRHFGRTQPVPGANVIVLEEHVDYWDRLGWKDPFSSEQATVRQSDYGEAFGGAQVYTPQMIVDGHAEFVGSSRSEALLAIRAAEAVHKPHITLSWTPDGKLAIQVDPLASDSHGDSPQVYLVIAENNLHSDVKRGENAGRGLDHEGVMRQLSEVGKVEPVPGGFSSTVTVRTQNDWNRANLRAIVFVQERRSRRVLAVSAIPFPSA